MIGDRCFLSLLSVEHELIVFVVVHSRGGTPGNGTPAGSTTPTKNGASTPTNAGAAARTKGNKIESVVASSVQLDLDLDF